MRLNRAVALGASVLMLLSADTAPRTGPPYTRNSRRCSTNGSANAVKPAGRT